MQTHMLLKTDLRRVWKGLDSSHRLGFPGMWMCSVGAFMDATATFNRWQLANVVTRSISPCNGTAGTGIVKHNFDTYWLNSDTRETGGGGGAVCGHYA